MLAAERVAVVVTGGVVVPLVGGGGPLGPASRSTITTTPAVTTATIPMVTATATMRRMAKRDGTAEGP